ITFHHRLTYRSLKNKITKTIFALATILSLLVLVILIIRVLSDGLGVLSLHFITVKLSTLPEKAGIMRAILGTLWLMVVIIPVTFIIGVSTAIYLELYAKEGRMKTLIQTNIANLAGVPSIVYGILGITIFVRFLQLGNVVLAGGLTMSLLILP